MKFAIYKNKIGLRAAEYADTPEAIKYFPYIKEESLPVIINSVGGYTSFNMEYEKENGFLEFVETKDDEEPLTREQRYPKNSDNFEYGWISPEGDTYNTGVEGHFNAAEAICEEIGFGIHSAETTLEDKGWVKVTAGWQNGVFKKSVYANDLRITKKQADTLFDLGLWETDYVPSMLRFNKNNW